MSSDYIEHANYLVGARCYFYDEKFDMKVLSKINSKIFQIMEKLGFDPDDIREIYLGKPMFVMTFYAIIPKKSPPILMRVKKVFGITSQSEVDNYLYFEALKSSIDEHPRKITFTIRYGNIKDKKGYLIRIESEPLIISKIRQIFYKPKINQSQYNNIIDYNKRILRDVISSLGAGILEEPEAISPLETIRNIKLFEEEFLQPLSLEIRDCLDEANRCYSAECYRATSIMIRKALEIATIKKFYQTGNEKRLFTNSGDEISLKTKLNILPEIAPEIRKCVKDIELLKWFGDTGAHDPKNPIFANDIEQNIIPKMRAFLVNLELK